MKKVIILYILILIISFNVFAFNESSNESIISSISESNLINTSSIIPMDINPYKNKEVKEIKFNDLNYIPLKGINSNVKLKSKLLTKDKKTYAIMQFNRNPSKEEKLHLEQNGVLVLDFISSNSYYVSIKSDLDKTFEINLEGDLKLKDNKFNDKYLVRSVDEIKSEYKLSKNLRETKIRNQLIDEKGNLYLIIKFHNNVNLEEAKKLMNINNITVVSEIETLNSLVVNLGGGEKK